MDPFDMLARQSIKVGSLRGQAQEAASDLAFVIAINGKAIPEEVRNALARIADRLRNAETMAEAHANEIFPQPAAVA